MPHVVSRNAMTLATPVNELKFYYHVSDLIGNNYSPQAKSLNIKSLNDFNKLNEMTSPIKSTPNRIATQSVPDFLFASSKEANRVSPNKENSFSKSVKLPPIVDAKHTEENGDVISNLLSENCESNIFENSKNITSPSFVPVSATQSKQTKLFKRRNHIFLDDDSETVTSVKSLGSNVNFSNHSGSLTSGISSKTHLSVNYGPNKYKIKRSHSLIFSDYDNDSMFDTTKQNGIETIQEQNEQINEKRKVNNNSSTKENNSNSSKVEELFAILLSGSTTVKKKNTNSRSRINDFSIKNKTSSSTSIGYASNANSKLTFHQSILANKTTPSKLQNHESDSFYSRQNHKLDKQALKVTFAPWFVSTQGLTRSSSPVEESEQRYFSILNESIKDSMLAEVNDETLENIESRVKRQLLESVKSSFVENFESEIRSHYMWSMKKCILDYILKEENEQKRLGIKLNYRVRA
jgi:hypothetical protein